MTATQIQTILSIKKEDFSQIQGYLAGYDKKGLQKIFFLFWNAIKHIFGCSNWQKAEKILNRNISQLNTLEAFAKLVPFMKTLNNEKLKNITQKALSHRKPPTGSVANQLVRHNAHRMLCVISSTPLSKLDDEYLAICRQIPKFPSGVPGLSKKMKMQDEISKEIPTFAPVEAERLVKEFNWSYFILPLLQPSYTVPNGISVDAIVLRTPKDLIIGASLFHQSSQQRRVNN